MQQFILTSFCEVGLVAFSYSMNHWFPSLFDLSWFRIIDLVGLNTTPVLLLLVAAIIVMIICSNLLLQLLCIIIFWYSEFEVQFIIFRFKSFNLNLKWTLIKCIKKKKMKKNNSNNNKTMHTSIHLDYNKQNVTIAAAAK